MYGSGAFGDAVYGDVDDGGLVPQIILFSCSASIEAAPVTNLELVLKDQRSRVVFSAEIHPWVLSGRG
jgi:hypothetical protein